MRAGRPSSRSSSCASLRSRPAGRPSSTASMPRSVPSTPRWPRIRLVVVPGPKSVTPWPASPASSRQSASSPASPGREAAFGMLDAPTVARNRRDGVELRRDAAVPERLLVDVHHLGLAELELRGGEVSRPPPGSSRRHRSASSRRSGCRGSARGCRPRRRCRGSCRRRPRTESGRRGGAPSRRLRRGCRPPRSPRRRSTVSVSKPCSRAASPPIARAPATIVIPSRCRSRRARARSARTGATGWAPSSSARRTISRPSVPLRPTRPPRPATGLTMRPSRLLTSSDAMSSAARRAIATISSSSASVTTNVGEKAIVSDIGSAREISPSSSARRYTRMRDLAARARTASADPVDATNSTAAM